MASAGNMEALAGFTATAVDALSKEGFCVIQLPLSQGLRKEDYIVFFGANARAINMKQDCRCILYYTNEFNNWFSGGCKVNKAIHS